MTSNSGTVNISGLTSLSGQTVGKYRLQDALGAGGMATVYRAEQVPLGRTVAVKVLHPHLTNQSSFRDRFLREAKAVAALRHQNIVQIFDYDVQDGVCYIALEFLDGTSLEDRLMQLAGQADEPIPLPMKSALEIIAQVARALTFAHNQRIVHRDIKPANIMQTADGRIVLTDFGIATILHETRQTVDGSTSGTPLYMSPEQALGERGDERSDIYSLGAVLYQLVTGRLPFEADTLYGLIMMHINDTPTPASDVNPRVPQQVAQIIQKAMAKDPDHRYQTAAEFAADIEAALAGKTITVDFMVPPKPRQKQKMWWGVAAAALVAVIGLSWYAGRSATPPVASTTTPAAVVAAIQDPDFTHSMAVETEPNVVYSDTFDDNRAGWPETDGPVVRQLVDGAYQISVAVPDTAVSTVPDYLSTYNQFSYQLEATLVGGQPESGYGLVFNRRNSDNYYVFAVNGLRQWSVWRLKDGEWRELRQLPGGQTWTASEAVNPPGEANRLLLHADGGDFTLFVNGTELTRLADPDAPLTGGLIGMYVASSRSAAAALARAQFDNLQLEPLPELTAPSMAVERP